MPISVRNVGVKRTLSAEELAGDVESLAADNNDLLAIEELLGDDAGEATKEMALAIDDDLFRTTVSYHVSAIFPSQIPVVAIVVGDFIFVALVGGRYSGPRWAL